MFRFKMKDMKIVEKKMKQLSICLDCNGSGLKVDREKQPKDCKVCKGEGIVKQLVKNNI